MKDKIKSTVIKIGIVAFWLIVWEISARLINVHFIFPPPNEVAVSLAENIITSKFWLAIVLSFARILIGLCIGVIIAVVVAWLATKSKIFYEFLMPVIVVVRSTPVASFIMILWLLLSDVYIPSLIALLIVFPVVFESAYQGLLSSDGELMEMAEIFEFSEIKKNLYIKLPSMMKYTLPSVITASGLAWKSGIAAEIITQVSGSIGREIALSKNYLEGQDLFAWTAVVVILSLLVEWAIKYLSGKVAKAWD